MSREPYIPPQDDDPLDAIELALARTLAKIIAKEIREEERQRLDEHDKDAAPGEHDR